MYSLLYCFECYVDVGPIDILTFANENHAFPYCFTSNASPAICESNERCFIKIEVKKRNTEMLQENVIFEKVIKYKHIIYFIIYYIY